MYLRCLALEEKIKQHRNIAVGIQKEQRSLSAVLIDVPTYR